MAYKDYGDLATGNSALSPTFGNEDVQEIKEEAISEQRQVLAELLPGVKYIEDACEAEIAAISDIRAYIKSLGGNARGEAIQDEYRARELYIGFLNRLKTDISDKVSMAEQEANR